MLTLQDNIKTLIFIILTMSGSFAACANENSPSDIRILIDVSGSMKQNDPNNLRQPALRLLTGLLPAGSEAGVWTFGQFVNMLVKYGHVDNTWKEQARLASDDINSHGLFTNIEDTLRDATWDWNKPTPERRRNLILLTDGLVDISGDPSLNQASRNRILDDILPRLQQAEINIHTVALSNDADEPLLRQLSSATQGSFSKATTAQDLERLFLHMFESTTQAETLPLLNNTIQVDNSIREMTLLVFRQPNSPATRIILPDGSNIELQNVTSTVNWHHENNYDLITIQKPPQGTWTIDAAMDPDNRALVVTDLNLESDRLPTNIATGERHSIDIRLSENNQPIINKEFLHFIKVTATQFDQRGEQEHQWPLLDNGLRDDHTENDGTYTLILDKTLTKGRHELIIDIDGTTFTRQQRLHFEAFEFPVITAIETNDQGTSSLYISPINGLIDPDSMQASVIIDDEDMPHQVPRQKQNEWQLTMNDLSPDKRHSLIIDIVGKREDRDITSRLEPIFFGAAADLEPEPGAETEPQENTLASTENHTDQTEHASISTEAEHLAEATEEPGNNILILIETLIFNIIIAGLIFVLYKKYKSKLQFNNPLEELPNE